MKGPESKAGGEFFRHVERADGTRDLYFGELGGSTYGHAVIDSGGNVKFVRESDGHVVADDNK